MPQRPNGRDALHCLRYAYKFQTVSAFLPDIAYLGGDDNLPDRVPRARSRKLGNTQRPLSAWRIIER